MNNVYKISKKYLTSPLFVAIIAGIALGIGFIVPPLAGLAVVGVVGCIYLIEWAKNLWWAGVYIGIAWTIKSLCSILWFWAAYPISWITLTSPVTEIFIIFLHWMTGALWLGAGGVFFGIGLKYIERVKILPRPLWYILVPVWCVVGELAGALTFSFIGLGPGSYLQTYFSFGFIGYLLGYSPFGIAIAPYGGVYTLTAIMASLGVFFFVVLKNRSYQIGLVGLVGVIICAAVPFSLPPTPSSNMSVISINTRFDAYYLSNQAGQQGRVQTLETAVTEALVYNPQFIILPEDSRYLMSQFGSVQENSIVNKFLFTHPDGRSIIIDSGREDLLDGTSVLRAHLLDATNNQFLQFDKQYLVPQGEYVPALYGAAMHLFGYGPFVEKIEQNNSYRPGPFLQSETVPAHLPAILFCFESVRPDGVQSITHNRQVPFVAHPISHAWFHSSKVLWQQLDVMLQIQARQSGVPIVSAGNMVPGKLYLPDGTIETGELLVEGERYELRLFSF